jgi:molybdate transport system substrate-binding protein
MKTVRLSLVFLLAFAFAGCVELPTDEVDTLTVSAAADLRPAFEEIGAIFTARAGVPVGFNFGSTGTLVQQVLAGAPVDVLAAANTSDVERLADQGIILPDSVSVYAIGRLVLYSTKHADIAHVEDLARPGIERIAIANPDHAPYGVAARETMRAAGIWNTVQDRLVLAENAGQTFQFAETGNVDVALAPLSLSIGKEGSTYLVPAEMHRPIVQALGIVAATSHAAEARQFVDLVMGPEGREILGDYGFQIPEEA